MINILIAMMLIFFVGLQFDDTSQLLNQLWQMDSFGLVLLGTLTATILQFPLTQCLSLIRWVIVAFKPRRYNFIKDIKFICNISDTYKQSGSHVLNSVVDSNKNHFLTKALSLVVDGASTDILKTKL